MDKSDVNIFEQRWLRSVYRIDGIVSKTSMKEIAPKFDLACRNSASRFRTMVFDAAGVSAYKESRD